MGAVAYKLDLPKLFRVYPVFHVSSWRAQVGPIEQVVAELSELKLEATELALEKVLA